MNGIAFYEMMRDLFPVGSLQVAFYVNPLAHNLPDFKVQFVEPGGRLCSPLSDKRHRKVVAYPLAGPFYRLTVIGINFRDLRGSEYDERWVPVWTTVRLWGGQEFQSSAILVKGQLETVKQKIEERAPSLAYRIEKPIRCEMLNELVQKGLVAPAIPIDQTCENFGR